MHHRGLCGPAVLNGKPEARLLLVQALCAGGTRVYVQHVVKARNPLHPKDVAVPAHQHVGRVGRQLFAHALLPPTGPPGDMGHPEVEPFHRNPVVLKNATPDRRVVDVAPHGRDRGHRLQPVQDRQVADVPGVQDPVHARQVVRQVGVEVAVGVREDAERRHGTV